MNTCHECETKNIFHEDKIFFKKDTIAYSRSVNIQRECDLLASTEITSDIVILGTRFLLLLQ